MRTASVFRQDLTPRLTEPRGQVVRAGKGQSCPPTVASWGAPDSALATPGNGPEREEAVLGVWRLGG